MVTEKGNLRFYRKYGIGPKTNNRGKNNKFLLGSDNKGRTVWRMAAEELHLQSLQ